MRGRGIYGVGVNATAMDGAVAMAASKTRIVIPAGVTAVLI